MLLDARGREEKELSLTVVDDDTTFVNSAPDAIKDPLSLSPSLSGLTNRRHGLVERVLRLELPSRS